MQVKDFKKLFEGSSRAHGTYEKSTGRMATVLSPASETDFENHLNGKLGLGIIPVDENGMCWWGAIDIDVDTVDQKNLYSKIKSRNIPLNVCRSKSGGAHLYVFFKEQQAASVVQGLLRKWAALLGYPKSTEIFPKQVKSTAENIGNWLNLPYFSAANTMRYAVRENGSIDIDEFMSSIVYYNGYQPINENLTSDLIQIDLMPPCLKIITQEGLEEGYRNRGLFNFGIFYKKSSPNNWQDKLHYHNQNYVSPSLPRHEVETIIKSIDARQYQYTCSEEPICSRCDKKTCLTLTYGVGYKPWEDNENYDVLMVQNLRKINTDPPTYTLEVDSRDIHLTSTEFMDYAKFKKRVLELLNIVLGPMKQGQWDLKIKQLLCSKTEIEAPDNASYEGSVLDCINEYLSKFTRETSKEEDLLQGNPCKENSRILFPVISIQRWLHSYKLNVTPEKLFAILMKKECEFFSRTIRGKSISIWSIPIKFVHYQTEDFTPARFEKEEEEL